MFTVIVISCGDDDDGTPNPNNNNNTNNNNNNNNNGNEFMTIATDPTGDAGGGLDATEIEYMYDATTDEILFRVTVIDLVQNSSSPSLDFNFKLPNGTDGSRPLASPFRGSTMTHKSAAIYTDDGGNPPSNYTFNNTAGFARNNVLYTVNNLSGADPICNTAENCIFMELDVTNNTILCVIARDNVITDSEMGSSNTATIELVANVGTHRQNNDLVADGVEFTITIP